MTIIDCISGRSAAAAATAAVNYAKEAEKAQAGGVKCKKCGVTHFSSWCPYGEPETDAAPQPGTPAVYDQLADKAQADFNNPQGGYGGDVPCGANAESDAMVDEELRLRLQCLHMANEYTKNGERLSIDDAISNARRMFDFLKGK